VPAAAGHVVVVVAVMEWGAPTDAVEVVGAAQLLIIEVIRNAAAAMMMVIAAPGLVG